MRKAAGRGGIPPPLHPVAAQPSERRLTKVAKSKWQNLSGNIHKAEKIMQWQKSPSREMIMQQKLRRKNHQVTNVTRQNNYVAKVIYIHQFFGHFCWRSFTSSSKIYSQNHHIRNIHKRLSCILCRYWKSDYGEFTLFIPTNFGEIQSDILFQQIMVKY